MMFVCSLSNGAHFSKSILKQKGFSELKSDKRLFPDGETYFRFLDNVKEKEIILVQSLYPKPNDSLIELFLASRTAKELGAKKVIALVPYMGYLRQDNRFHDGESFSAKEVCWLLSHCADEFFMFDGHLHRIKNLSEVFSIKAVNLHAEQAISKFIDKKFSKKNTIIVGPDGESSQWAKKIANYIGFESAILSKKRFSDRKVKVIAQDSMDFKGKDVVIVDDIVSTGHTVCEAAKELRKKKAKSVHVICVHALLVENALEKIKRSGVKKVYSCNTIAHKTNVIDLGEVAAEKLLED